jgi:hypothetical protein
VTITLAEEVLQAVCGETSGPEAGLTLPPTDAGSAPEAPAGVALGEVIAGLIALGGGAAWVARRRERGLR